MTGNVPETVWSMFWVLEGKVPRPANDQEEMAMGGNRHVGETEVTGLHGTCRVSTVFLGLDHGHGFSERPVLFETMIFGAQDNAWDFQQRYCTWEDAEQGHAEAVAMAQAEMDKPVPSARALDLGGPTQGTC